MQKQIYSSPTTDIIEMAVENSVLTGSSKLKAAAGLNDYYTIIVGEDDSEFE